MVIRLLWLRFRQLFRVLQEGGISLWLTAILLGALLISAMLGQQKGTSKVFHYGVAATILLAELVRKDKRMPHIPPQALGALHALEYLLLALLFCAPFWMVQAAWEPHNAVLLLVLVPLVGGRTYPGRLLPDKGIRLSKNATRFLPLSLYELRFYGRQSYVLFYIAYLASWIFAPVVPVALPIAGFAALVWVEYLRQKEPLPITAAIRRVRCALLNRAFRYSACLALLFMPQLLVFSCQVANGIAVLAGIYLLGVCFVCFLYSISSRYRALDASSPILGTVRMILFLFIAPLLPVSAFIAFKTYRAAKCQLNQLLSLKT